MLSKKRFKYFLFKLFEKLNIFNVAIISGGITHAIFIIIFINLQIWELATFNIFSTLLYLMSYFRIKKHTVWMIFIGIETWLHAVFAYLLLGPDCGFQLYLFTMAQIYIFVEYLATHKILISYYTSAISALLYIILMINDRVFNPFYINISNKQTILIHLFNFIIAFFVCLVISIIFTKEIKTKEKGLKNQNKKLSKLASVDPLTNLLNRRSINEYLDDAMITKRRLNIEFTVAICDIDDFKMLNDKFGHDCGDLVLKNVAKIIKKNVRDIDYVCRWGGEEILILFSNSKLKEASKVIERIHSNINDLKFTYKNENLQVTMTFGICSSEDYYLVQDIILQADANMYVGKNKGKNCVIYS